jgi:hypothetical protein
MFQVPTGLTRQLGDYNIAITQEVNIEARMRHRLHNGSVPRRVMSMGLERNVQYEKCRSEGHDVGGHRALQPQVLLSTMYRSRLPSLLYRGHDEEDDGQTRRASPRQRM